MTIMTKISPGALSLALIAGVVHPCRSRLSLLKTSAALAQDHSSPAAPANDPFLRTGFALAAQAAAGPQIAPYAGRFASDPRLAVLVGRLPDALASANARLSTLFESPRIDARAFVIRMKDWSANDLTPSRCTAVSTGSNRPQYTIDIVVEYFVTGTMSIDRALVHELAHCYIHAALRNTVQALPMWILEGIPAWIDHDLERRIADAYIETVEGRRRLQKLAEDSPMLWFSAKDKDYLGYQLMWDYLATTWGYERTRRLIVAIVRNGRCAEAIRSEFGLSLDSCAEAAVDYAKGRIRSELDATRGSMRGRVTLDGLRDSVVTGEFLWMTPSAHRVTLLPQITSRNLGVLELLTGNARKAAERLDSAFRIAHGIRLRMDIRYHRMLCEVAGGNRGKATEAAEAFIHDFPWAGECYRLGAGLVAKVAKEAIDVERLACDLALLDPAQPAMLSVVGDPVPGELVDIEANGVWPVGDVDSDGEEDYCALTPARKDGGNAATSRVVVVCGRTRQQTGGFRSVAGDDSGTIGVVGGRDLNGDGRDDYVLRYRSDEDGSPCGLDRLCAIDGKTGNTLWGMNVPGMGAGGDGATQWIGISGSPGSGVLFVVDGESTSADTQAPEQYSWRLVNGSTGAIVSRGEFDRSVFGWTTSCSYSGNEMQVVVGGIGRERNGLVSGGDDGTVVHIWRIMPDGMVERTSHVAECIQRAVCVLNGPSDFSKMRVIAYGEVMGAGSGLWSGTAECVDVESGKVLWQTRFWVPEPSVNCQIVAMEDIDGDGVRDWALVRSSLRASGSDEGISVEVHRGGNGRLMYRRILRVDVEGGSVVFLSGLTCRVAGGGRIYLGCFGNAMSHGRNGMLQKGRDIGAFWSLRFDR